MAAFDETMPKMSYMPGAIQYTRGTIYNAHSIGAVFNWILTVSIDARCEVIGQNIQNHKHFYIYAVFVLACTLEAL